MPEAHHLKCVAVVCLTSKQVRFKQFGNSFSVLLAKISLHLYEMKPLVYTPMWTDEYEVCLCSKMLMEDCDNTVRVYIVKWKMWSKNHKKSHIRLLT